jgi:hypothetical protein
MENQTNTLVFTNEELSVIFEALSNLPYKSAAPIIGTMQQQLQASFEEKKKKFEEEAKEKK